jgi:hypothetical protein
MLAGLMQRIRLTAQAKTGLSPAVIVLAVVALIAAGTTFVLLIFTAFIWLAERYTPLTAALILVAFFLLVTILAAVGVLMAQRRTVAQAQLALQSRSAAPWLDPSMLGVALQVGRNIGLRRVVPLVAAGVLAAGFAKEWLRDRPDEEFDDSEA